MMNSKFLGFIGASQGDVSIRNLRPAAQGIVIESAGIVALTVIREGSRCSLEASHLMFVAGDCSRFHAGLRGQRGVRLGYGVGAPKNTPAEIIGKLNKEINAALPSPVMKARLADLGGTVFPTSPAEFGKFIADDTEKWAR
jgi:Tripartite tricarboxylate transporter family receptor